MRKLLITLYSIACLPLYAGIEVSFPTTNDAKDAPKLKVLQAPAQSYDPAEPVRINGLIVYYIGGYKTQKSQLFDELKEGMTLKEIVSLLGPGSQSKIQSGNHVSWHCIDGRVLTLLPPELINEKVSFHIGLHGTNQRHEDVARLAKSLISTIKITGRKVEVTLKQDTDDAKARKAVTYEAGQMFQKLKPQRIDFYIQKIEGDSVHCQYYYEAPPEGLLHYSENGDVIIQDREQDGGGQPATRPESK